MFSRRTRTNGRGTWWTVIALYYSKLVEAEYRGGISFPYSRDYYSSKRRIGVVPQISGSETNRCSIDEQRGNTRLPYVYCIHIHANIIAIIERATRVIDTRVSDYRVNVFFHDFHPRFLPPLFLINPPSRHPCIRRTSRHRFRLWGINLGG